MPKQLSAQLSTHTVHLGSGRDRFEVTVRNLSDRFASFALDLSAAGLDRQAPRDWYRLTPDLAAKIPAGDQVSFAVNILEVPPIPGGFVGGKMNLNVNVTCLELGEEDRQLVNLVVSGSGSLPATVKLPQAHFDAAPGDLVEIPLQIYNPNRSAARVRAALKGVPTTWLNNHERKLQIAPKSVANVLFACQPPFDSEAGSYPLTVEVSQRSAPAVVETGRLEILPVGDVALGCFDLSVEEAALATASDTARESRGNEANYLLELDNRSNVTQPIAFSLNRIDIPWTERLRAKVQRRLPRPASTTSHWLHLSPADVVLKAGDRDKVSLSAHTKSSWLGWPQRQVFQVRAQAQQTAVVPATQTIELISRPRVPLWIQSMGLGVVGTGLLLLAFLQGGHRAPVNSVQFDGQANTVVSAADDSTIRRWQVSRRLKKAAVLEDDEKAVRVVQYRPRENNVLAAGMENGEIRLWDLLAASTPLSLVSSRDDRVFDLQFSDDSSRLFSIHGSGQVLQWDLSELPKLSQLEAASEKQFDFAAQSMALVGEARNQLAVGGRFNRLVLWDFERDRQQVLDYPGEASSDHYLFDVAVAADRPTRFAAADNQGRITLWDLETCSLENCRPTDRWTDGHKEMSVNAVALSQNACYLISGGDDGRVVLWSLNKAGQVMAERVLRRSRKPINSVDIVQQDDTLLVVSGGDDRKVKLQRTKANNERCL